MDRLPYAPAHRPGEPPTAYASRIAAAYGLNLRDLCRDSRISRLDLVNGAPQAIEKLAVLGGADQAELTTAAFVRTGPNEFRHRGQTIRSEHLVQGRLAICPACIAEDVAGAEDPETAFFCRADWLIDVVDTCPKHGTAIVAVQGEPGIALRFDFSSALDPLSGRLREIARTAELRIPTPLQDYVLARLEGRATSASLLDAMHLSAAIHTCELLGTLGCFGGDASRSRLDAAQLRTVRATGFDIAARGREGIHELLKTVADAYALRRPNVHEQVARRAFAELHGFLRLKRGEHSWKQGAIEPLRDAVAAFIKTNFPLAPGDEVLGEKIETRALHSVSSLAKEIGFGPDRTRKLLVLAGTIAPDAPVNVVFDAQAAIAATRESRTALPFPGVAKYLGATRHVSKALVDAKLIEPILSKSSGLRPTFLPEAVDAFVARLAKGAMIVKRKEAGQATIAEASARTSCAQIDVVNFILEGRLAWVGRIDGTAGYNSILVDVSEVEALAHGLNPETISVNEFARRFGLVREAARALVAQGFLAADQARRAGGNVSRVSLKEAEAFGRSFVTLGELARTRGVHHVTARKTLDDNRVSPVIDHDKVGVVLYRRDEVAAAGFRLAEGAGIRKPIRGEP